MCNQVLILAEGYSRCDPLNSKTMFANCTSVLIKTQSGKKVIVDTMTAWDGEYMVEALKKHSVEPKEINYVVCTHGHSDHTGCNYLFTNAEWHFVGTCLSRHNKFVEYDWDKPFELVQKEIEIIFTPGHTSICVSVLIYSTNLGGTVGVCGDLFENETDIWDSQVWINAGSENQKLQRESRCKLASLCSYLIPGHGPGFNVTDNIRTKLQKDLLSYI